MILKDGENSISVKVAVAGNRSGILLAFAYTSFIQLLTGIPHPSHLEKVKAEELILRFSREVFDYPYWLQDLSHLPLFAVFAWMWMRCLGSKSIAFRRKSSWLYLFFAVSYAIGNELSQFLIPQRYPSLGDTAMNLTGVVVGTALHKWYCRRLDLKHPKI